MIHKYKLLLSKRRMKEYVIAGCEMLAFYFRDVYNKPEVKGTLIIVYYMYLSHGTVHTV